jgi:hypothetical protein
MQQWLTRKRRVYLYSVAAVIVPLLIAYDALSADLAPLWLALAAAVLGIAAPATALANLTPEDGDYASVDEPEFEVE